MKPFFKLHNPTSYAYGRDHERSNLVGHRLKQTKNEQDVTMMNPTDKALPKI